MELLSPAGNIDKLAYAYRYGADAAYIGVGSFSLRRKAESFHAEQADQVVRIAKDKRLYCALNIYFHGRHLRRLEEELDVLAAYPFDAFIVSDIGVLPMLRRRFPGAQLHLSTQANCVNAEAARMYHDMGFSRIILGRELGLPEIAEIKAAVPRLELEAFVHGAMCLAYSGRCFLSAWMADRSANQGNCSHSCRWEYRVLEERERPGEYYPIEEGEDFTTILSSRDLCMIDHLPALRDAGVDSVKIEGRMKSVYYTAVVTRAYRKMLDSMAGASVPDLGGYREELFKVSHREFTTGFYFGKDDVERPTEQSYARQSVFLGTVGPRRGPGAYEIYVKNQIRTGESVQYIGPDLLYVEDRDFRLFDCDGNPVEKADHGRRYILRTGAPVEEGFIVRRLACGG
jgi:U32 family peptidase